MHPQEADLHAASVLQHEVNQNDKAKRSPDMTVPLGWARVAGTSKGMSSTPG
jgi:hypothetical protein